MKKVEKLTARQESLVTVYRDKWLNIGRSTTPINKEKCVESIKWLYSFAKKEKVPYMWFCDSPLQAQLLINILKYEKILENNLRNNLGDNLRNNLRSNLRNNLGDNLRNNLRSNLWSNLGDNLRSNLWSNLWNNLESNLRINLESNLVSNLESNLESNLWSNLGDNLWDNLRSNLWNNLESNLRSNLWNNLRSNLRSNLRNNLRSNLRSNLVSNLESNLWSNLRKQELQFNYFFSPNTESYWVGFYDFILHEIFPKRISEFSEFSNQCRSFYENTYLIIPFDGICFISERPTELNLDIEGRLHNLNGPVMKFKDGYEFYALDGIRLEKETIEVINKKENPSEILKLANAEQRLVAIKYYGVGNMLPQLDSRVEDTFKDYKLHSILLEGEREKLLEMKNPSEPKTHYEFVPPEINTCQEAMAWRVGFKLYKEPVAHS